MAIQWSAFALESLEEIIIWYELEAGRQVADSIQNRIWRQVEKIDGFAMSIPASDIFPGTCLMWPSSASSMARFGRWLILSTPPENFQNQSKAWSRSG
jgi:hypothetical protein